MRSSTRTTSGAWAPPERTARHTISRRVCGAVAVAACLLGTNSLTYAQNTAGSVSGVVQDAQGAVVPGATVSALNENENKAVVATHTTNNSGVFVFDPLQASTYTLKVDAKGFKTYQQTNILLNVNDKIGLPPIVLEIGAVSETISVEANAVQLETETATRSAVVDNTQIVDLPISSRSNISTAFLREVQGAPPDVSSNFNGMRTSGQVDMLDGVTTMDAGNNGAGYTYSIEAIAEVKVTTDTTSAEYGRSSGYQVASVLKSGTNAFHGSGFWFHKNEGLNANSFTNNQQGIQKSIARAMDSGFTIGGPVIFPVGPLKAFNRKRQKLFFFTSFEFTPNKSNSIVTLTSPTAAEATGNFAGVLNSSSQAVVVKDPLTGAQFAGNVIPASRINSYGQSLLQTLSTIDAPNISNEAAYNVRNTLPVLPARIWNDIFKVDYNVTEKHRLSVHWLQYHDNVPAYGGLNTGGNVDWTLYPHPDGLSSLAVNFVSVLSPTMTNEFNLGYSQNFLPVSCPSTGTASAGPYSRSSYTTGQWGSLPILYPGVDPCNMIPNFNFSASNISNAPSLSADGLPYVNHNPIQNYTDNITRIQGTHTIKAGLFIETALKGQTENADANGSINFAVDSSNPGDTGWSYANALLGNYDTYTQANKYVVAQFHYHNYEWYVQDAWKVRHNLTVNYGMRMTLMPPWTEGGNLLSSFEPQLYNQADKVVLYAPTCANGVFPCSGANRVAENPLTGAQLPSAYIATEVPGIGNRFNGAVPADTNGLPAGLAKSRGIQWGPRLGFSWAMDPKTVIRGGASIAYTRVQGNETFYLLSNPPQVVEAALNYGNISSLSSGSGTPLQAVSASSGFPPAGNNPTVYNINVGVQRQLPLKTILDTAFVGTISNHDINLTPYNDLPYGSAWLPQNQDPTLATTSSTVLGANALSPNAYRPYLGYAGQGGSNNAGSIEATTSNSHYYALQVSVQHRASKRFQIGANYVWSKIMGTSSADFGTVNPFNTRGISYGPLSFNRGQYINVDYVYSFPDLARKGSFLDHVLIKEVLNGWQIQGITGIAGGAPSTAGYAITGVSQTVLNQEITGSEDIAPRGVLICNPATTGPHTIADFLNTACILPASKGSHGADSGIGAWNGLGYRNWDASMIKRLPMGSEKRYGEIRIEAFNVFNHTEWSGYNATPSFSPTTNQITNFQSYTTGVGGGFEGYGALNGVRAARSIQLGAKFYF